METEYPAFRFKPLTLSLARMLATECLPDPRKHRGVHDEYLTNFLVHVPGLEGLSGSVLT